MPQTITQSNSIIESFDIRKFADRLEPAEEKNKYICPVCGGNDLSIHPDKSPAPYQCFHGCSCDDIREAIAPWSEKRLGGYNKRVSNFKQKNVLKAVPLPDGELAIARLSEVPSDIPQPTRPQFTPKPARVHLLGKGVTVEELSLIRVISYDYGSNRAAHRYEAPSSASAKGYEKTFLLSRIDDEGVTRWNKGKHPWKAYRQDEALAAMKAVPDGFIPILLSHEGEKCVEYARLETLAGITMSGGGSRDDMLAFLSEIKSHMGESTFIFAHCTDNDPAGVLKAEKWANACQQVQIPFVAINLKAIQPDLCDKGDIADILKTTNMTGDQLAELILAQIKQHRAVKHGQIEEFSPEPPNSLNPDVDFIQQAINFLYGDRPWISVDEQLYRWEGTYYRLVTDAKERQRISNFCNSYCVWVEKKNSQRYPTYPYVKPAKVKEVLEWAKIRFHLDPEKLNPPGINCTNGVVEINWVGNKPIPTLKPHDYTKHFFTYEPLVKYDPHADPTYCERMLECLDQPQQEVLLRNLAASIDLPEVRKRRGRAVKLLLACGTGSNGKDSLRQVTSLIYGHHGMTSISLADFAHYDEGRKFALAALLYSRINWASENPQTMRLDKIQSLKLFATGNKLHSERKGKDFIEFNPKATGIFNLNDVPPLQGTSQAIQDRFAALEFKKTFTDHPDPNDPSQLLADPRFAYDDDFLVANVASAFLNKMLVALEALITEGIDYSCTLEAFKAMQKENNHLLQFCEDIGLGYSATGVMGAMDIWNYLEQWYIDNGTLTIEDGKKMWAEQAKPSDRNIKAPNQVLARFKQLFPKAQLATVSDPIKKRKVQILKGISIITHSPAPVTPDTAPVPHQLPHQETLINQDLRTSDPNFFQNQSEKQKDETQSETLTPLNTEVDKKSPQLGSLVRRQDTASVSRCGTGAVLVRDSQGELEGKNELEPLPQEDSAPVCSPLKPLAFNLEVGDSILCYPSADHADRNKAVKAIVISVEESDGWFVGCTIEYNKYDYVTKEYLRANARIPGGCYEWITRKL